MAVGGINILQNRVISVLEYSPAHALAIGYYNNFLKEAVSFLVKNGEKSPKICIYKPSSFKDLTKENIDLVKSRLRNENYVVDVLNMDFERGRVRDVITIHKNSKLASYFDFPSTLTSLESYVDYKLGSKENSTNDVEKAEMMTKLIEEFYKKLFELFPNSTAGKSFKNVIFCETDLSKFLK